MSMQSETLEGYAVDIACLRCYPRAELLERARTHSRECATMGHCVESGFGLVAEDGALSLLDAKATPLVFELVRRSQGSGLKLRVRREMREVDIETTHAELA